MIYMLSCFLTGMVTTPRVDISMPFSENNLCILSSAFDVQLYPLGIGIGPNNRYIVYDGLPRQGRNCVVYGHKYPPKNNVTMSSKRSS